MTVWPLHLAFATLLAGSLAVKERADALTEIDPGDLQSAVVRIAQSHWLTLRDQLAVFGNVPALLFDAPGCSRPVLIALRVDFDFEPFAQALTQGSGDVARYVYIDRSWEKPDRLGFFVYRAKYAALATFGLTRYVPGGHLMLVASSPDCQSVSAIDWRNAWDRGYVLAGRAGTAPVTGR